MRSLDFARDDKIISVQIHYLFIYFGNPNSSLDTSIFPFIIGVTYSINSSVIGLLGDIFLLILCDEIQERKELFRSGMNVGRDMVGTMTNTLILAFLGSSFVLILYLYSIGLSTHQLLSSSYLSIEVISGISSSIGVILSIPITAFITAKALAKK